MDLFKNVFGKILFVTLAIAFVFSQESSNFNNLEANVSSFKTPWASRIQHTGEPFGGYIITRLECDCEGTYIVAINDYVSRSNIWLKVDKQSKIYEYGGELTPNKYTLGTYNKGATCKMQVRDCKPAKVDGVINSGPGAGVSK